MEEDKKLFFPVKTQSKSRAKIEGATRNATVFRRAACPKTKLALLT
jgi:hypothetical protein